MLGGQDELVFDGNSFVMDGAGAIVMRARSCCSKKGLYPGGVRARRRRGAGRARHRSSRRSAMPKRVSRARDGRARLCRQTRFPGVVMGLSGGIDSALTLAIAVDALGRDHVHAVMTARRTPRR